MDNKSIGSSCYITTGKLDANQAVATGKYPFFTCAEFPDTIDSFAFNDDVVLVAGNNARGNFHVNRFKGKFNAYQRTYVLTAKESVDIDYIYYALKLELKRLKEKAQGSQTKFLTMPILTGISLNDIGYDEQVTIAKTLAKIDDKIAINNKINAELEAMAKLIYDYWFVQFDFPDANGKPYKSSGGKMVYNEELKREIPNSWTVDVINNVIDVKDGTHDSPKTKEAGYPLITSKHLKPEGLDFDSANLISEEDYININKRSKVDTGDILFSMIGSIGEIYKVDEKNINFAIKNVALYKSSKKPEYMNFIYTYLKSYDMQRYMGNVTSGSIQKFIGLGALRNMPIFTNDDMIMKFVNTTEHLFQKKTLIKLENQELTRLRDWILPMLMNGQVTVK
jgi:type I restriction enzyme S subunit